VNAKRTGTFTRRGHILTLGLLGAICLSPSCKSEQACGGLSIGSVLAITILGSESPANDSTACDFDLTTGQVVDATVVANMDAFGICYVAIPTYGSIGHWTWTLEQGATEDLGASGGAYMQGIYAANDGSCQGTIQASLTPTGSDLFAPETGTVAPAAFSRIFTASSTSADAGSSDAGAAGNASCPSSCGGYFPVRVQRVH